MRYARWPLFLLLFTAGCAGREKAVPVAAVPAPVPVAVVSPPDGATPGMLVPEPLADGSFPTPNQRLSEAGTLWHLRAGLNVAALSCPGAQGDAIRAGYNGWLTRRKPALARIVASYAAEYRVATPAGRASFDEAMTRLYNFFSQTPVRPEFCAAAAATMAAIAASDAPMPAALADARLAALDRPFIDFYRAYDAWRRGAPPQTVIAAAAVTPAGPAPHRPGALVLDLSTLPVDSEVAGAR